MLFGKDRGGIENGQFNLRLLRLSQVVLIVQLLLGRVPGGVHGVHEAEHVLVVLLALIEVVAVRVLEHLGGLDLLRLLHPGDTCGLWLLLGDIKRKRRLFLGHCNR